MGKDKWKKWLTYFVYCTVCYFRKISESCPAYRDGCAMENTPPVQTETTLRNSAVPYIRSIDAAWMKLLRRVKTRRNFGLSPYVHFCVHVYTKILSFILPKSVELWCIDYSSLLVLVPRVSEGSKNDFQTQPDAA